MVRRFSDVVQVRPVEGSGARPEAFIWKGRLYVVRQVLAQWRERRAWWREALDAQPTQSAQSCQSGQPSQSSQSFQLGQSAQSGQATPTQVQPGAGIAAAAAEQRLWRVEASPGWSFAPGVYDLAHDESAVGEQWSLVRVAD